LLGLDTLLNRIPIAYMKAVTAVGIAADFVYGNGLKTNEVDFAKYLEKIKKPN
jgi:hypothetical protein